MRCNRIQHKSIPKILTILLLIFSISATTIITQPLQVNAALVIDNANSGNPVTASEGVPNGVWNDRTGYVCYLLNKDGSIPSNTTHAPAHMLKSPGYTTLRDNVNNRNLCNIVQSRKGHTVANFTGKAPWDCNPWDGWNDEIESNEPVITNWMKEKDATGVTGCQRLIKALWGTDAARKFERDEYILVIETIMSFQYSYRVKGTNNGGSDRIVKVRNPATNVWADMTLPALENDVRYLMAEPVLGTIPNLVSFENDNLNPRTYAFDSYTLRVAPMSEFIEYTEAGFTAYPGDLKALAATEGVQLSISDVLNYGVAMVIYHARDLDLGASQSTCDEGKIPDPHDPPNESTGSFQIVKSYRTRNADGTYTANGTKIKFDSSSKISIEDEFDLSNPAGSYKLIGWATSPSSRIDIDSTKWGGGSSYSVLRNPAISIVRQKTKAYNDNTKDLKEIINLDSDEEKTLYLLLEKQAAPPQRTCDEGKKPDPHDPPNDSTGRFKIVKSYRTLKADGTYQHDATHTKNNSGDNIRIQTEVLDDGSGYKLKAWKTSTTYTTAIDSTQWHTQVPATIKRNGTSPATITMRSPETTLYLLLEKRENPPPVADGGADYVLSESTIARKIALSKPDATNPTWGFNILDKVFQWRSEAFQCNSPHSYYSSYSNTRPWHDKSYSYLSGGRWYRVSAGESDYKHTHSMSINYCSFASDSDARWDDSNVQFTASNTINNSTSKISYNKKVSVASSMNPFDVYDEIIAKNRNDGRYGKFGESVIPIKDWDYHTIIYRGDDDLVLAQWKNSALGTSAGWLTGKFTRGLLDSGRMRKDNGFYDTSFNVKIVPSIVDGLTIAHGITALISPGHGSGQSCDSSNYVNCTTNPYTYKYEWHLIPKTYDLDTSEETSIDMSPKVKVEVYKGDVKDGTNSIRSGMQRYNAFEYGRPTGATQTRGMEFEVGNVTFKPYIQMNYDIDINRSASTAKNASEKKVYVLGEFQRTLKLNDYAEVSWKFNKSEPEISFSSLQWSTHASTLQFVASFGTAYNVLPGGATINLTIDRNAGDTQTMYVTTYQCVVNGTGKIQVDKTNGTIDSRINLTPADAQAKHQAFVESVKDTIEKMRVQQWIDSSVSNQIGVADINPGTIDDVQLWELSSAGAVTPGEALPHGLKASKERKYFLSADNPDPSINTAGEGDFDVIEVKHDGDDRGSTPIVARYTFFTNTLGEIRFTCNNENVNIGTETLGQKVDGNAIAADLNMRTHIVDNLRSAIMQGEGNDTTGRSNTTGVSDAGNPKWYNEAFDGVTIYVFRTKIEVGFKDPVQRTHVLDPKTTKPQTGQSGMFDLNSYNVSQYCTMPLVDDKIGEFRGNKVEATDIESFIFSRKYFIPNATVQDLH